MSNTELQTVSFDEESNTETTYVTFTIKGESLDPVEITRNLGIQPTRIWIKGEEYLGNQLDPLTKQVQKIVRKRPWAIVEYTSKGAVASRRTEAHMLYLLDLLEPVQSQIDNYVHAPSLYSVKFAVYWKPLNEFGSYELASQTLSRMATLCQYTEFCFSA